MKQKHHALMINPWIEDFTAYDFWIQPLGLLKIATLLKSLELDVSFIDCLERTTPGIRTLIKSQKGRDLGDGRGNYYKTKLPKPEAVGFVPRNYSRYGLPVDMLRQKLSELDRPDLVCLTSTMTYWYTGIESLLEILHDHWPTVPIVMGGIYASLLKDHAKARKYCSRIFPGTSLDIFCEFILEFFNIDNDCRRIQKRLAVSDILLPDYSLLNDTTFVALETSRGCPYRCDYCASALHPTDFVQMPLSLIMGQLGMYVSDLSTDHVAFYDDALFFNPETHIKPLLRAIIDSGHHFSFHTPNGLFPKLLDDELARLMFKAGFKTIRLSLDTMSQRRQQEMGKVKAHDLSCAFDHLEAAGFARSQIGVYLLAGLPDQQEDDIENGLNFVAECGGISRLAQYSPIPGTRDWLQLVRNGVLSEKSDPLLHNPTVFAYCNPWITYQRYEQLKMLSLHLNREVVQHHVESEQESNQ